MHFIILNNKNKMDKEKIYIKLIILLHDSSDSSCYKIYD